ncbi:10370_t:CDS:2 [Dentiscutata erythropus]|uniref:10370_t:CDS:1 n=1 Tax=Dentiscutata erythropus TaxID=1348616 RepID=A0A9N9GQ96_9GLOM|nr:10370_t:CDS:2 [Dentiscutata erythropus]
MTPIFDEIREYDTKELIEYLQTEELMLNEKHFEIIRKAEITGEDFLIITEEELRNVGFSVGPAERLADFAKECIVRKRQKFSSIKSLRDVLIDYDIDSDKISKIPSFKPQTHEIQDNDEYFQDCINNILIRIKNYGTLCPFANEKIRREYVSTILHTALRIAEANTNSTFKMAVEFEVDGKRYYGPTDYAIIGSKSENLICITEDKIDKSFQEGFAQNIRQLESSHDVNKKKRKRNDENEDFDYLYGIVTSEWYFLLHNPGQISLSNLTPFIIEYPQKAWNKESNEYGILCKNVKKVLSIIVGLLVDKVTDTEPEAKRMRVEQFRSNGD